MYPFSELLSLKCNENAAFSFKNTWNKQKVPFWFESKKIFSIFYYFLNKALDKVDCKLKNIWSTLVNEL